LKNENSTEQQDALKTSRKSKILATPLAIEGTLYLAYSIFRLVISPLQVQILPDPTMGAAIYAFLIIMLFTGAYFAYRSYTLFRNKISVANVRLSTSLYSLPIWLLPALFALQSAGNLLANSEADGFYLLQVGMFFVLIGAANLASMVILVIQRRRRRQHHLPQA
jgi:hypothetical protein